ncbi:MAG: hypothetical protein LBV00_04450 [Propionibacteriaceae bacterium]|jgi:MGT family glycosyltransferase|nr:hypothetical protein [Propionibacteriaceae bacterium]
MAKILMVNVPYAGHINPTLALAKELVAHGHDVAYVNSERFRDVTELTGARFIPYADYPVDVKGYEEARLCFRAAYNTALGLKESFDLLIYEMLFYPGMKIAEKLHIPAVRQFSQPVWKKDSSLRERIAAIRACDKIQRQFMSRADAAHMGLQGASLVKAIAYDQPAFNIVYVSELFQRDRQGIGDDYIFTVPPLAQRIDIEPITYEGMTRPLIYISLGSIVSDKRFYEKCLKAFSSQPWSVILNTARVDQADLGPIPSNIHIYSYVPQVDVLTHADVFVTHCGMNSVNEAMSVGVPMVGVPVMNDEQSNAERLVELGLGRRVRSRRVSGAQLVDAVRQVLADPAIRQRSAEVKARLAGEDRMDEVVARIEALLA